MRKVTKSLLMILTLVFAVFTMSSCSKKIEYVYEEAGGVDTALREYIPYQEYVLDTTGTTHRKISKHKIAYDTYYLDGEKWYKVFLSNNVMLGVRYTHLDENIPSLGIVEEPSMLTPVSSSDGIDEYLVTRKNYLSADIVVVADKKTDYSIKVKAVFDKLGEDTYRIGEIESMHPTTATLEGNNNVYYVEKDIDENVDFVIGNKYNIIEYNRLTNSLDKSHEFMNIFTDEEEITYVTVNEKYINAIDNKYKINIRKADEYNIDSIMDSEGNVYIDGDYNEWVVVNLNQKFSYEVKYEKGEKYEYFLLKKNIVSRENLYLGYIDYHKVWEDINHDGLVNADSICIRKGWKYKFSSYPYVYLEVNGIAYRNTEDIKLDYGDIVGVFYYDSDNEKRYVDARISTLNWNSTSQHILEISANDKLKYPLGLEDIRGPRISCSIKFDSDPYDAKFYSLTYRTY